MFLENKYAGWYNALMAKRQVLAPDGYCEQHHIIPKSLGGSNDKSNLVRLTAREHFIAHALLVRITTGTAKAKMGFALKRMFTACNGGWSCKKYLPHASSIFEHLKQSAHLAVAENNPLIGRKRGPMSAETKAKLSASRRKLLEKGEVQQKISAALKGKPSGNKGKPMSDEQKAKVSQIHRGKKISDEQKAKLSAALTGKKQHQPRWSDERKQVKSEKMRGKTQGPHSEETKRKIGDSHRGKKISDEQKAKLSAALKKIWADKKCST